MSDRTANYCVVRHFVIIHALYYCTVALYVYSLLCAYHDIYL